jgi:hypothetical protein
VTVQSLSVFLKAHYERCVRRKGFWLGAGLADLQVASVLQDQLAVVYSSLAGHQPGQAPPVDFNLRSFESKRAIWPS